MQQRNDEELPFTGQDSIDETEQKSIDSSWHRPSYDACRAALTYRMTTHPLVVHLTLIVKLVTRSWRRATWLLEAQVALTNLTAAILEDLREQRGVSHDDGAAALVLSLCAGKRDKSTTSLIRKLADRLSARYKHKPGFTTRDYPYVYELRAGVYRHVAKMLGIWVLGLYRTIIANQRAAERQAQSSQPAIQGSGDVGRRRPRPKPEPIIIPDLHTFYDAWFREAERQQQLGQIPVPVGGFRQFALGQLRRKVLIELLDHFPSIGQVEKSMSAVITLLSNDPSKKAAKRLAAATNHLWRRGARHWRRPRRSMNPASQRRRRKKPLIKLGWMSQEELWVYYNQLRELRDLAEEFGSVRSAIEALARKRLPSYPQVYPVVLGNDKRVWYRDADEEALVQALDNMLQLYPVNRKRGTEHRALPSELARQAERNQIGYLQAVGNLEEPKLQPLSYNHSMRPGEYDNFTVLFRKREITREELSRRYKHLPPDKRETRIAQALEQGYEYEYRLVLALWAGHGVPATYRNDHWQTLLAGFHYLNAPETPFRPSQHAHYLVFPIDCGVAYQDALFREVIAYQREQQIAQHRTQQVSAGSESSVEASFPKESAIARMEILSERRKTEIPRRKIFAYKWNFFAHLHIAVPVPQCCGLPEFVVSIHEYKGRYCAAIIALDGQLLDFIDIQTTIEPPPQPDDETATRRDLEQGERYVYDLVKQMVDLGLGKHALATPGHYSLLALEDTSWRNDQSLLLPVPSQDEVIRPTARVRTVLGYKALRAGLLEPVMVKGVAPSRDCSACGARGATSAVHVHRVQSCPLTTCRSSQLVPDQVKGKLRCQACRRMWEEHELYFSCTQCGHFQLARVNTAVVVGLKGLYYITQLHAKATTG